MPHDAKSFVRPLLVGLLTVILSVSSLAAAQEAECGGYDKPIVFAELDWDSVQVLNHIARFVLEEGFGCATDSIPGSTIPMYRGAARGDIDVVMEVWLDNVPDFWGPAVAAGDVLELGPVFEDAVQGFYVPRYMVEGDAERGVTATAPDLRSVDDLPQYAQLFRDPEQPNKGRFYNCIIGWRCEEINNVKLEVYGLTDDYTNFLPGTAIALAASMESAYLRGDAWVGYYWSPTWVLGKLDMIRLEEPPYTDACWAELEANVDTPRKATESCAYPASTAVVALGKSFKDVAPEGIVAFLDAIDTPAALINKILAFMQESDATPAEAALDFLRNEQDTWTAWLADADLDPAIAERTVAALK